MSLARSSGEMMKARGGFSLLQVIIAAVILVLVGTSMAPRFSDAASDARTANLCENLQTVRRHIEVYRRLHPGRLPASPGETGEEFVQRITDAGQGARDDSSDMRLESVPANPYNRLNTVRVGGPQAGAGTHGWRFDPVTADFQADDPRDTDGDGTPDHTSL